MTYNSTRNIRQKAIYTMGQWNDWTPWAMRVLVQQVLRRKLYFRFQLFFSPEIFQNVLP